VRLVWVFPLLLVPVIAAGDEADEAGYDLRVSPAEVDVEIGAEGAVSLTIAPAEGYTIDRDGPLRIRVEVQPDKGLEVPQRRFRRKHAADAQAESPRFDLRYRAAAAGDYTVAVEARFWICRKYTCRAARETRRVPVRVREPAPPPPPPSQDAGP
jgi:hypothetical protein